MTNSMKTRGLSCEGKTCSLSTFLRGLLWSPQVSALWSLAGKPWACLYEYVWGLGEDSKYWFPAWAGKATSSAPPYTSRVLTHVYAPPHSMYPLECMSLLTTLLSNTDSPFLTCMWSSCLDSSIQQVLQNVIWNAAVLSWLTAFPCGYMLLNAKWII